MTEDLRPQNTANPTPDDAILELAPDDPRRTDNRGGLEAIIEKGEEAADAGPDGARRTDPGSADAGMTGADPANTDHDLGAAGTGGGDSSAANTGRLDMSTVGAVAPNSDPAGAGPVEGSRSGAVAPKVEVSDIGLMDLNTADMSLPEDESEGGGARVDDADGNPL